MLLRTALSHYDTRYVTTEPDVARQHGVEDFDTLPDCNQNTPFRALLCATSALRLVLRHRPQAIVSTGSAPGFFAILAGRLTGARTLWIDSFANAEGLSMSGRLSQRVADECWTQWEHLAKPGGPTYHGAVL
jgi:UDP-N-acetylglucosamine:LPS N-acetylglucosamine transferase